MEEQIYAFLAGAICGSSVIFLILLILGASGSDPDNW